MEGWSRRKGWGARSGKRGDKGSVCPKAGVVFHESHVHEPRGCLASGDEGEEVIHDPDTEVCLRWKPLYES